MCGIWGYIGNDFNKFKFDILGIYNDTRGGDSCGVFVGHSDKSKELLYGHDKTKLYKSFVEKNNRYNSVDVKFALGHARKASVGGISLERAQPVVIYNEKNVPIFVMIHNGTLINHEELAKKYDVEFDSNESDSQIFARVVFKAGYDVLREYDGAGAFVFWDKRDGHETIRIFKGASLYYNNDKELYIERPLFWMKNNSELWFSSMEESLNFINDSNFEIKQVPYNTLVTVKNGIVKSNLFLDRSERKQSKTLAYKGGYAGNYNNGFRNWDGNTYDGYDDDYYSEYNYERDRFQEIIKKREEENAKNNEKPEKYTGSNLSLMLVNNRNFLRTVNSNSIETESYKYSNKIFYDSDGLYKGMNLEPISGEFELTITGYIKNKNIENSFDFSTYWFVNGVMMKSYFHYLCAKKYIDKFSKEIFENDELYNCYLAPYSVHPIPIMLENGTNLTPSFYCGSDSSDQIIKFTGKFLPFFDYTTKVYDIENGEIQKIEIYSMPIKFVQDVKLSELDNKIFKKEIDSEELEELIKKHL